MSKSDEYRENAAECQRMADITNNADEKRMWLEMAESWMRMIKPSRQNASDKFDAAERERGTGQTKSEDSH